MRILVKSIWIIIAFLFIAKTSTAQSSNLIFFTESGERFSVIINGVLRNAKPETNVRVTDLFAPTYKVKIIFQDTAIPQLDKTITFGKDLEITYCIKKNSNNVYVLRFQNQVHISNMSSPQPGPSNPPPPSGGSASVAVNQNTTTITTVNNVNAPGGVVTINVTNDTGNHQTPETGENTILPGYHGHIGCPYPITDLDFENVKKTIAEKSFEDSKLQIAKQVTSSNCLFSEEVRQIMELFSFEKTRLDYAKYAYKFTYDPGNYYKVNSAFSFEFSVNELNEFIDSRTRE
jgi:hypothetical protein